MSMSEPKKHVERIRKDSSVEHCIIEGCGLAVKSRGLCSYHYSIASGRVKTGKASWAQFEQLGVAKVAERKFRVEQFDAAIAKAGR